MKHRFLFLVTLLALSLFAFGQMAQVPADTAGSPCNRHYEAAVKFLVDTPVVHPFTVSAAGTKVLFSKGNLQYCPARDEWRFALRQFDRVGNGKQAVTPSGLNQTPKYGITTVFYDSIDYSTKDPNTKSGYKEIPGIPCNNLLVSKYYNGWIDLFAWGTSGHGQKVGDKYARYFYPYELNDKNVNTTYNRYGYGPSYGGGHGPGAKNNNFDTASGTNRYFDWGYANNIREYIGCEFDGNGGLLRVQDSTMYRPGVWRTLTSAEWTYLLVTRKVGGEDSAFSYVRLKYGENTTDTVSGMIIYPDDFSFSEVGVASIAFGTRPLALMPQINAADWEALENAGCIFLPSSPNVGYTKTGKLTFAEKYEGLYGGYWGSTGLSAQNSSLAYWWNRVGAGEIKTNDILERYQLIFVRLAQDLK